MSDVRRDGHSQDYIVWNLAAGREAERLLREYVRLLENRLIGRIQMEARKEMSGSRTGHHLSPPRFSLHCFLLIIGALESQ